MGYNMKYEDYNDCLYLMWNRDKEGNLISVKIDEEPHVVSRSMCMLKGIPDKFYRVLIDGMIEVEDKPNLEKNEFEVDYTYGLIRFNEVLNDKVVTIKRYYARGNYYIPSSRIYYKINPIDGTVVTMYDILEKVREELMIATDNAKKMNDILNDTINTGKKTNKDLLDAIALAKKLITELGVDQYVKHVDTGNESGKIPINNKKLNVDLNADTLDGKHAIDLANRKHTHTKYDITDFPEKLPADGGNADTVGGKRIEEISPKVHTHIKKDITDMNLHAVAESGKYSDLIGIPVNLPANGGNADTIENKGVNDFVHNLDSTNVLKMKYDTKEKVVTINNNDTKETEYIEKAKLANVALETNLLGGLGSDGYGKQTTEDIDFYVNVKTGDDNNDGNMLKPFKTIQHALDVCPKFVRHNVRIHIANGEYHENIIAGGFLGIGTIRVMADTSDYSQVKVKGTFRNYSCFCRLFTFSSVSFIPDPILIAKFIEKGNGGKDNLSLLKIEGSMNTTIENCYVYQSGLSVDYLCGVHFNFCGNGRCRSTMIRNTKAKIRGVGIMSDNGSDVFCWNCDVNGTFICYYTQAGTIRVYNPIEPSSSEKDYTYLKLADANGNAY